MTTHEKPMGGTEKPVIIMNFSGVYKGESFAHNPRFIHLDCSHLQGTDCYCDRDGAASIQKIIAGYPAEGIHFIDSGDYHYMTKFWTDKISAPFSLVLFDHHTDMQPPRWSGMLSCGGWVKDMLDENAFLRHVFILGIPESQESSIPEAYRDRVMVFTDKKLHEHCALSKPLSMGEPLYISIDKDVLAPDYARTDWDQGILTMDDLKGVLSLILRHENIIGTDVCGECPVTLRLFDQDGSLEIDDEANRELLGLFKKQGLF